MMAALRKAYGLARWLVRLEIGIWRSLFLWTARRVPGAGPGVRSFSYAKQVTPILLAFIFVSVLELAVVHLLLPWATVRLIALVISVWGLLWMAGYLASMRVFRHLLTGSELRVRHGTDTDIRIPLSAVAAVNSARGHVPTNRSVQVERLRDRTVASVAMLKLTNVAVTLRHPLPVAAHDGRHDADELRFYVDDPRGFVAAARERLAAESPRQRLSA